MEVLGRKVRFIDLPAVILQFTITVIRSCYWFKRPLAVLYHYVNKSLPEQGFVELRDGTKIFLSTQALDVVTVVLVFCRSEYGSIEKGSVVIDIGANIGAFSLLAARAGARKVYAFEPNPEVYACLEKNVRENGLDDVVIPCRKAVAGRSGERVLIPVESSPANKTQQKEDGRCEPVETISVDDVMRQHDMECVDLLKMDCEGAEYDIIPSLTDSSCAKIKSIRMEYHEGDIASLLAEVVEKGFKVVSRTTQRASPHGIVWCDAVDAAP